MSDIAELQKPKQGQTKLAETEQQGFTTKPVKNVQNPHPKDKDVLERIKKRADERAGIDEASTPGQS